MLHMLVTAVEFSERATVIPYNVKYLHMIVTGKFLETIIYTDIPVHIFIYDTLHAVSSIFQKLGYTTMPSNASNLIL